MTIRLASWLLASGLACSFLMGATLVLLHPAPTTQRFDLRAATTPTTAPPPIAPAYPVAERPTGSLATFMEQVRRTVDDGASLEHHFDSSRMGKAVGQMGAFIGPPDRNAMRLIHADAVAVIEKMTFLLACSDWTYGSLQWTIPQREVIVLTTHPAVGQRYRPMKLRWWCVFTEQEGWRLFDVENLTVGGRLSSLLATNFEGPPAKPTVARQLANSHAAVVNHEHPQARTILTQPAIEQLPLKFRALIDLWRGVMANHEWRKPEAIDALQIALQRDPQLVVARILLAEILDEQQRFGEARTVVQPYVQAVPNDDRGLTVLGHALAMLADVSAADFYRRALVENPDSIEALNGLRQILDESQMDEIGVRLNKARNPAAMLPSLVSSAIREMDQPAARTLIEAFMRAYPNHPEGFLQAALLHLQRDEWPQAFNVFGRCMANSIVADDRETYLYRFLPSASAHGRGWEAYDSLTDAVKERGFRIVAESIVEDEDLATDSALLERLIASHRKKFPADRWADFYQAEIHTAKKEYPAAERLLAKLTASKPSSVLQERVAEARIHNFALMKQPLKAYELVPPRRETFRNLIARMHRPEDVGDMEELIQAHAKADPKDPLLLLWQGEVHYRKARFAEAITALEAFERQGGEWVNVYTWKLRDRKIRTLARMNRTKDLVVEAEKYATTLDPLLKVLVPLAANDLAMAEQRLQQIGSQDYYRTMLNNDPDIQHLAKNPAVQALLQKYPPPKPK